MSQNPRNLKIVAVFQDPQHPIPVLLHRLHQAGELVKYAGIDVAVAECHSQDDAIAELGGHLDEEQQRACLLLSDLLVDDTDALVDKPEPSEWAKEVFVEFAGRLLATLAITEDGHRVAEIDRVLPRLTKARGLLDALKLVSAKLRYIAHPGRRPARRPVIVRPIIRQRELRDYFRLRHRVYKTMGYLTDRVEQAPTRMEINWCDRNGIHIGAFEQRSGGAERLIGTARVVCTSRIHNLYEQWSDELAARDAILKKEVSEPLPLWLPIFHSFESTTDSVIAAVTGSGRLRLQHPVATAHISIHEDGFRPGELSRIIVAEEYRGMGLAKVLAKAAVLEAVRRRVDTLFLECLDLHVPIYHELGFEEIDGQRSRVIGVGKTMVGMQMLDPILAISQWEKPMYVNHNCLCCCRHRDCYGGAYALYGTPDCFLHARFH